MNAFIDSQTFTRGITSVLYRQFELRFPDTELQFARLMGQGGELAIYGRVVMARHTLITQDFRAALSCGGQAKE